jgi:hypothetical protein
MGFFGIKNMAAAKALGVGQLADKNYRNDLYV